MPHSVAGNRVARRHAGGRAPPPGGASVGLARSDDGESL